MKPITLLFILITCIQIPSLTYAKSGVIIEKDAAIYDDIKGNNKLINLLVLAITTSGYKCNSVSAVRPLIFGHGFNVKCNNYYYSYDIKDEGGNWVIKVN